MLQVHQGAADYGTPNHIKRLRWPWYNHAFHVCLVIKLLNLIFIITFFHTRSLTEAEDLLDLRLVSDLNKGSMTTGFVFVIKWLRMLLLIDILKLRRIRTKWIWNKNGKLPGQIKSPLHKIEDTIVEFALQRSLVKRPFNQEELIEFANSLINDTPLQYRLIAWQTKTNTLDEIQCTVGKK